MPFPEKAAAVRAQPVDVQERREQLRGVLDDLLTAWSVGNWHDAREYFTKNAVFDSSQHGRQHGFEAISAALSRDRLLAPHWRLQTSNHYIGGTADAPTVSAYLTGEMRSAPSFPGLSFNASLTMELSAAAPPRISGLRIAIDWIEGDVALVPHWVLQPVDRHAAATARCPQLVLKRSLTWPHVRDFSLAGTAQDSAVEVFSRYAWALDQGDAGLLGSCFTEDAVAICAPIGVARGRHAVVAKLQAFALPEAWLQHIGDVLTVAVDDSGLRARMLVGRIAPWQAHGPDGMPIYIAHYRLRLRRDNDRLWKLTFMQYCPGWVHARQLGPLWQQAGFGA